MSKETKSIFLISLILVGLWWLDRKPVPDENIAPLTTSTEAKPVATPAQTAAAIPTSGTQDTKNLIKPTPQQTLPEVAPKVFENPQKNSRG